MMKCPGQDPRFWKADDIFQVGCVHCGEMIEFFKDDLRRRCRQCGKYTVNPKNALGCAEWCKFGPECLGLVGRILRSPEHGADEEENAPE